LILRTPCFKAGVSCIGTFRNNRKSGSRFIWENNGHSDVYLIKLSSILNHSSTSITRRYLGISREEIKDIYQSFDELM